MISESFIKFRQAVGKLCTIPFRESAHSPTSTLLLPNAAALSAITLQCTTAVNISLSHSLSVYVPFMQGMYRYIMHHMRNVDYNTGG